MAISRRNKTEKLVSEIKREIKEPIKESPVEFLGSGGTHLNLALSGTSGGGWGRGRIHNIVGDGSSGKTALALEEAFWFYKYIKEIRSRIFPRVKSFEICYDNGEGVMDFPVSDMYGTEFYKAINWDRSPHFEAMCRRYYRKTRKLKKGQALLYIIDSWDSFKSAKSMDLFLESVESDTELKGDYDMALQKYASGKFFPNVCNILEDNGADSTLCIISQVRSKINALFGKKQYRAGGKALDFYTHQVAWLREIEKMRKKKFGEMKVYGIRSEVAVDRNKLAKPFRVGRFTILYDYGLDDTSSILDYVYGPKKSKFNFRGVKFKDKLSFVKHIERNKLQPQLIKKAQRKWDKVEDAFTEEINERPKRY